MDDERTLEDLNTLLADYMVYYQKLRNYHWMVSGHEFFKLHQQFDELYELAADWVDQIAERILALDGEPHGTMAQFVEHARLDEDEGAPPADQMVQNLIDDIQTLNDFATDIAERAESTGDRPTANLLDDIVDHQEQKRWMFKMFLRD